MRSKHLETTEHFHNITEIFQWEQKNYQNKIKNLISNRATGFDSGGRLW